MKIPTAIIGLGNIGLTYDLNGLGQIKPNQVMTHCQSVSRSDFFAVKYLIDTSDAVTQMAVHLYGGVGIQSLTKETNGESPKFVIISVPTSLHLETLLKVINRWNPCIYLIEKPFGINSKEALKMAALLQSQDARVYINYVRRYLPNFLALKSSSVFQDRGRLNFVRITGYGTLENVFSHFFDLLLYLEGSTSLGVSKKITTASGFGMLKFKDDSSGVQFELKGIGQSIRECEMTLVFDSISINITSNGRCIQVNGLQGNPLVDFNLDQSEFDSYQAIVLKKIQADYHLNQKNSCVEDAVLIHKFIESI